jgi:hypothetical protein
MTDSSNFNQPANVSPSVNAGQVAPPTFPQEQPQVPGAVNPQVLGQPAQQQPEPAAPQQPQVDYAAQLAAREAELQRIQSQNQQLQGVVSQIQRAAEENQQAQAFNQELTMMLAHADNLPADQARSYLQNQFQQTIQRERVRNQQQFQQFQQQAEQEKKAIAAPLYADHLLQANGLPPQAKEELLALGDPDLMFRMAPQIKARYDAWNAQIAGVQQSNVQVARAAEVQALQNAGLGAIGGQNTGTFQVEIPDDMDPDERAMLIDDYQRYGPGYQPRR